MATDFDDGQLDAITGGDAEFEREILTEYLASAPKDIEKLRATIASGNAAATGGCAHALKGASATIGARGLARIALEIEQAGKANDLSRVPQAMARLEAEFGQLVALIRERLARAA